jgi:menaquinone-dependent protoporphyrinogen IX oxidase
MKSVTSLAGYNAVVIGAPVYTGKVIGDVVVFVTANKDELSHLPVAGPKDMEIRFKERFEVNYNCRMKKRQKTRELDNKERYYILLKIEFHPFFYQEIAKTLQILPNRQDR